MPESLRSAQSRNQKVKHKKNDEADGDDLHDSSEPGFHESALDCENEYTCGDHRDAEPLAH